MGLLKEVWFTEVGLGARSENRWKSFLLDDKLSTTGGRYSLDTNGTMLNGQLDTSNAQMEIWNGNMMVCGFLASTWLSEMIDRV